jgi:D-sedoheptulose 7-phosphate isomerase
VSDAPIHALVAAGLRESAEVAAGLSDRELLERVSAAGAAMVACYRARGKAILFGNGGSAGEAGHLAGELVGSFRYDRPPLPALSLAEPQSTLTAISNDYGYESSFSRQVEAHVRPGDVVIGLTTSGASPNVIAALRVARERGATTIAMTGRGGAALADVVDHLLLVASAETPRIQEAHLAIGHVLCELVEAELHPR